MVETANETNENGVPHKEDSARGRHLHCEMDDCYGSGTVDFDSQRCRDRVLQFLSDKDQSKQTQKDARVCGYINGVKVCVKFFDDKKAFVSVGRATTDGSNVNVSGTSIVEFFDNLIDVLNAEDRILESWSSDVNNKSEIDDVISIVRTQSAASKAQSMLSVNKQISQNPVSRTSSASAVYSVQYGQKVGSWSEHRSVSYVSHANSAPGACSKTTSKGKGKDWKEGYGANSGGKAIKDKSYLYKSSYNTSPNKQYEQSPAIDDISFLAREATPKGKKGKSKGGESGKKGADNHHDSVNRTAHKGGDSYEKGKTPKGKSKDGSRFANSAEKYSKESNDWSEGNDWSTSYNEWWIPVDLSVSNAYIKAEMSHAAAADAWSKENKKPDELRGVHVFVKKHSSMGCALITCLSQALRDHVLRVVMERDVGKSEELNLEAESKAIIGGISVVIRPRINKEDGQNVPTDIFVAWGRQIEIKTPLPCQDLCNYFDDILKAHPPAEQAKQEAAQAAQQQAALDAQEAALHAANEEANKVCKQNGTSTTGIHTPLSDRIHSQQTLISQQGYADQSSYGDPYGGGHHAGAAQQAYEHALNVSYGNHHANPAPPQEHQQAFGANPAHHTPLNAAHHPHQAPLNPPAASHSDQHTVPHHPDSTAAGIPYGPGNPVMNVERAFDPSTPVPLFDPIGLYSQTSSSMDLIYGTTPPPPPPPAYFAQGHW